MQEKSYRIVTKYIDFGTRRGLGPQTQFRQGTSGRLCDCSKPQFSRLENGHNTRLLLTHPDLLRLLNKTMQ